MHFKECKKIIIGDFSLNFHDFMHKLRQFEQHSLVVIPWQRKCCIVWKISLKTFESLSIFPFVSFFSYFKFTIKKRSYYACLLNSKTSSIYDRHKEFSILIQSVSFLRGEFKLFVLYHTMYLWAHLCHLYFTYCPLLSLTVSFVKLFCFVIYYLSFYFSFINH